MDDGNNIAGHGRHVYEKTTLRSCTLVLGFFVNPPPHRVLLAVRSITPEWLDISRLFLQGGPCMGNG